MGPITAALQHRIAQLIQQHRVLVWYDSARNFQAFVRAVELPGTVKLELELEREPKIGYFALRRRADPVVRELRAGKPGPHLLVYIPGARLPEEKNLLFPLEEMGEKLEDDLSTVARDALKGRVPEHKLNEWRALPELSLELLDRLAEGEADLHGLEAVFGRVGPQEAGLQFLRDPAAAAAVERQKLTDALRDLLETTFGVPAGRELRTSRALREAFARRVLLHEFLDDLDEIPRELAHLRLPDRPVQVAACRELAEALRRTRGLEDEYRTWAADAERVFGFRNVAYEAERLGRRDTFQFEAEYALRHARDLAVSGRWEAARKWIEHRSRSFWASTDEELRGRWHGLTTAVELRLAAELTLRTLPSKGRAPADWVRWYAGQDEAAGWRMDRLYRRLDALTGILLDHPDVEEVVRLARQTAAEAERCMAERFWDCMQGAGGDLGGVPLQQDVFGRQVAPLLDGAAPARVVLVLADALRFEMGAELAEMLSDSGSLELGFAAAALPTLTRVGMAALVPGAENGVELAESAGSVVPRVAGEALPALEQRRRQYEAAFGARVRDLTLDDCLTTPLPALSRSLDGVELLLLRSQDLDAIGETDNLHHARTAMSRVIPDLQRGVHRLAQAGFREFVVSADHGYLLRDDIGDAMKLAPPAGEVLELHRRCAIGRHLTAGPECVVFRAGDLGLGGSLELAFPRGINVFRAPGNTAYQHGGTSLQEMVVPVLRYTAAPRQADVAAAPAVTIALKGAKKVTNAVFQVELARAPADLFDQARRFRVTVAGSSPEVGTLGAAMQATHGFRDPGGEVELAGGESSIVLLYLTDSPTGTGELELRVEDVEAGETICRKKVPYELAF